jgi:hypothetical protein
MPGTRLHGKFGVPSYRRQTKVSFCVRRPVGLGGFAARLRRVRRAFASGLCWLLLGACVVSSAPAMAQSDTKNEPGSAASGPQPAANDLRNKKAQASAPSEPEAAKKLDAAARPPLANWKPPPPPVWRRRIEVGGSMLLVHRPFNKALAGTDTSYRPALAWGLHLHWNIFSFLRFSPYFIDAHHSLRFGKGALAVAAERPISATATIDSESVRTFVFGAKFAPTWNLSKRARVWLSAGVGWGRFEFPKIQIVESGQPTFDVNERDGVFVEVPVGLGVSFDVIPRWLAVEYQFSAAPVLGQSGNAHEAVQAVDPDGTVRNVAGFGAIEASFTQSIGLSILL